MNQFKLSGLMNWLVCAIFLFVSEKIWHKNEYHTSTRKTLESCFDFDLNLFWVLCYTYWFLNILNLYWLQWLFGKKWPIILWKLRYITILFLFRIFWWIESSKEQQLFQMLLPRNVEWHNLEFQDFNHPIFSCWISSFSENVSVMYMMLLIFCWELLTSQIQKWRVKKDHQTLNVYHF